MSFEKLLQPFPTGCSDGKVSFHTKGSPLHPTTPAITSRSARSQSGGLLVMVNIPRCNWCFRIASTRQLIGRAADAGILIPPHHRSVSRRHAEIWFEKNQTWLNDLGSRGGTRVNGICLQRQQPASIVVGDRLTLGGCELRLEPGPLQSAAHGSELATRSAGDTFITEDSPLAMRDLLETLTYAEHNILLWIGRGYIHDSDLGAVMHRSPHTIRTQIGTILKKLKLRSRSCIFDHVQRDCTAMRIRRASRDSSMP